MVQAITCVVKETQAAEIKTALFNEDPAALLKEGTANTPIMNPQ